MKRRQQNPIQLQKKYSFTETKLTDLFKRAQQFHQLGELDRAQLVYEEILSIQPRQFNALHYLGVVAAQKNNPEKAVELIHKAIKLNSNDPTMHSNMGLALQALNRLEEALKYYENALLLQSNLVFVHFNRGNVFKELKRYEEALISYDKAIALAPSRPDFYTNRGNTLKELKRFEDALESYDRALAINAEYINAHYNKGVVLKRLGRLKESLACFEQVNLLSPNHAHSHLNRGTIFHELNHLDDAVSCYQSAIAADNSYADAHWNKSLVMLLKGNYEEGWKEYEWRNRTESFKSIKRNFTKPLWLGKEDISGKTILLCSEQGLGDTIQFCRFAKLVKELGATVIMEVPKQLTKLLSGLEGVDKIITNADHPIEFDYYCPLMSLPLALGTTLDSIPQPSGYLNVDSEKNKYWAEKLQRIEGLKVGVVWNGGFRPDQPDLWLVNERRNIPLKNFSDVFRNIDATFISLQKGNPAEAEILGMESYYWPYGNFINHANELSDFTDTAALISNLDLVISVDTSTAHLSCALGKTTWILNRYDTCWRWMLDRDDSPWYSKVKIYRQDKYNSWGTVLHRAGNDLKKLVNKI